MSSVGLMLGLVALLFAITVLALLPAVAVALMVRAFGQAEADGVARARERPLAGGLLYPRLAAEADASSGGRKVS